MVHHHCYICGTSMDDIKIDPRDGKPAPCTVCESVIKESLEDFDEDTFTPFIESGLEEFDEEINKTELDHDQ